MFLASKFKALDHITSDKLVMFTDYSITIQELKVGKLTKKKSPPGEPDRLKVQFLR